MHLKPMQKQLVWFAAQSGPLPDQALQVILWDGSLCCTNLVQSLSKIESGMLTQAMKNLILVHGGTILTDTPVEKILVRSGSTSWDTSKEEESFRTNYGL